MRKFNITVLNVFAILGVILFLVLFVCAAFIANNNPNFSSLILPIVQIILGVLTIIFTLIFTKRAYHLFIGMFLLFWGFVILLAIQNFIPYSVYQWWPVLGISSGFFIFLSGLYKYKKINFGYLLPSLVLFLLGIYFMLFSFKIIKISFLVVAAVGGPLFMIFLALLCIVYFYAQQKNKNLIVKDEEPLEFDDDEIVHKISDE